MSVQQIATLAVIGFAILVAWNLWRGTTGFIHLYVLSVLVLLALVSAMVAQVFDLRPVIEPANLAAIALSLAGCASSPRLWQEEMEGDLKDTELYRPLAPSDWFSWRGWLKAVDRIGAGAAALAYLGLFGVVIAGVALTVQPVGPAADRGPSLFALAPAAVFAGLSTWYLYRGVRRLVPGA